METIILNIDGQGVVTEQGKTVLAAALDAGIYIPNLCHHPDLRPIGVCRLCVVEIEGIQNLATSCTTPAEAGMVVRTKSAKVDKVRRLAAELLLSVHPSECSTCPKYGQCEFQSIIQFLGVSDARLRKRFKAIPVNTSNPYIIHDLSRCVLCGRCVRACRELRGVEVLDYRKKNGETRIGTGEDLLLADAGCRFCGACVEVCPTGTLRYREGLLLPDLPRDEALVPCRATCPAGIDIPRYVRLIREQRPEDAAAVIREKVPFPLALGHVCNHLCESACGRREVNEAVSIRELKRFATEQDDGRWKESAKRLPASGKKIAVIGGGPAGLSAAYYLAKQGHRVTVFEALPEAGGMLRYGIPAYRLPTEVVANELAEIEAVGVEIRTGTWVDSVDDLLSGGFGAVLIAVGSHQGIRLPIPGAGLAGVLVNVDFLREVRLGNAVEVGRKVVVIGGGNVAFDCARVARRLGAAEVHVACLEARDGMTADLEEIGEAEEEGIRIHNSRTFLAISEEGGRVAGVECQQVASFSFDENGRPQIETVENSEHTIAADTVIFAVGQRPQRVEAFGLLTGRGNTLQADLLTLATSRAGVFAAGDVVTGTVSVIEAIASGKKAAVAIDRYLGGDGDIAEVLAPVDEPQDWIGRADGFAQRSRHRCAALAAEKRLDNFDVVGLALDAVAASEESSRCLRCDLRTRITEKKFWGSTGTGKVPVETLPEPQCGQTRDKMPQPPAAEAEWGCTPLSGLKLPSELKTLLAADDYIGSGPLSGPDGDLCAAELARSAVSFLKGESCGKCVLCREGSAQLLAILTDITIGKGKGEDLELLQEICEVMQAGAVCDVGKTAAQVVLTGITTFREEFEAHIRKKRCPALVCRKFVTYHILGEMCQGCHLCGDQCPEGAIAGDEGMIHVIDQDECTKCGTCLRVCPVEYGAVVKAGGVKPKTPDEPVPVGSWRKR